MNERSGPWGRAYLGQHRSAATVVAERVRQEVARKHPSRLVFCSRSGPPQVPWLEPDVNDYLEELAKDGASAAVIVPIGFVSDHMEVIYDLDTEARATADRLSFPVSRAATPGIDPRFVGLPRELLVERAATERGEEVPRVAVGGLMAAPDLCAAGCCPNPRGEQPVIGGPQSPPRLVHVTDVPTAHASRADELRDLALEAARAAAAHIRERRTHGVQVADTKSSDVDVVTQPDRESEALIRRLVLERRPGRRVPGRGDRRRVRLLGRALGRRPDRRHRQLPLRPAGVLRLDRRRGRRRGGRRRGPQRRHRGRVRRHGRRRPARRRAPGRPRAGARSTSAW